MQNLLDEKQFEGNTSVSELLNPESGGPVQDVPYAQLRARLLADGQILEMPEP